MKHSISVLAISAGFAAFSAGCTSKPEVPPMPVQATQSKPDEPAMPVQAAQSTSVPAVSMSAAPVADPAPPKGSAAPAPTSPPDDSKADPNKK
jgi:hypothetical protein